MAKKHTRQEADNFMLIRGMSRPIESRLHESGILTYAKLASLNPRDILSIVGDVNGITAKRINREDWTAQARELCLRSASEKQKGEEVSQKNLPSAKSMGLTSCVVELLFDEEGQTKSTNVLHVDTGSEETWEGWQGQRLLDFFIKHAALYPPSTKAESPTATSAEQLRESKLMPDAIPAPATTSGSVTSSNQPIKPRPAPSAIVASTDRPSLREFETIPVHSNTPSWVFSADQPFDVRLTLDFTEMEYLKKTPLNYKATLYAKSLKGRLNQSIGEAHGLLVPTDKVTINIDSVHLPGGSYRLQAAVGLIAPSSQSGRRPYSILQSGGKLLEVY